MDGHDDNGEPIICCDDGNLDSEKLFYLGHSCDEWIIGGSEQVKEFISELQKLLDKNPDVKSHQFRVLDK